MFSEYSSRVTELKRQPAERERKLFSQQLHHARIQATDFTGLAFAAIFALSAAVLRLMYFRRRWRLMTLLDCLPIILYFVRVLRFCVVTMKVCARRFNVYFALAAAVALLCGCQTNKHAEKTGALRVHIETSPGPEDTSQTVSVLRSDPVAVTIASEPILTEANIIAAKIIESPGGFAIEVQFDESSALTLEQFTAANPGRHLVIYGQWGDKLANGRWLAAPIITHRISNGVLAFTPDASHDEADRLVLGLNSVAKEIQKGLMK
jgi:hypothetical protein